MTEEDPDFWKDLLDETNGIGRKEDGQARQARHVIGKPFPSSF